MQLIWLAVFHRAGYGVAFFQFFVFLVLFFIQQAIIGFTSGAY